MRAQDWSARDLDSSIPPALTELLEFLYDLKDLSDLLGLFSVSISVMYSAPRQ